jgi:ElaA protein
MNLSVKWTLSPFNALRVADLYEVLQLRSEVFVVEQRCLFQDMDGADPLALHLLGHQNGQLQAYARCFPAGVKFTEASFGRVLTRREARGCGLGHVLVKEAISSIGGQWGAQAIRIGAQAQLTRFYSGHGFVDAGVGYVEDGIDHLEMLWQP